MVILGGPLPPGKPTLKYDPENLDPDTVTIKWDPPAFNGGSKITGNFSFSYAMVNVNVFKMLRL